MGYISEKTVQEIFDTVKVEDVVGDFVHLKKRGANLIGLCPFHGEKTPSFTVSPAKGIYKCFGCGAGGNAVNFVMEHETLSYPEALRFLAQRYNIEIEEEESSEEYKEQQRQADSLYIINDFAQKHFAAQMQTDYGRSVGLSYFKERGLLQKTIDRFGLGFANGRNSDLLQTAKAKGYDLELLQKAGLATQYGNDFFRTRVMFPVHNLSGKVLGFGGRMLGNNKKQPKYLNTPESDIYQKSKILYGIYQARQAIVKAKECYMVEGYMDVLALSQAGIENVVASSGTSLTPGQIQLVKRYTPNLTLLYDGDKAGIKAALRGLDLILEQDMNAKVVLVPEGEDPDSYLQKVGLKAFRAYLEQQATDFILFKMNLLLEDKADDPLARAELLQDIVGSIARIPDSLKRATYVRSCAQRLEISEQILHIEVNKRIAKAQADAEKDARREERQQARRQQRNQQKQQLAPGELPPPMEEDQFGPHAEGEYAPDNMAGPATDPQTAPAAVLGHFQEKDILRLLINFGDRAWPDAEEADTLAEFILIDMGELLDEFDHPLYAEIIELCIDRLEEGEPINSNYFTQHPKAELAQLAINLLADPYIYSPGWERLNVYLNSQEMPEQNHVADAKSGILRFKLHKQERLLAENQQQIKLLQSQPDKMEDLILHLKIHQKLKAQQTELAAQLKTVILR